MDLLKRSIEKSVPSLSNLSKVSHENEILSKMGFDWTLQTPSESAPDFLTEKVPYLELHTEH